MLGQCGLVDEVPRRLKVFVEAEVVVLKATCAASSTRSRGERLVASLGSFVLSRLLLRPPRLVTLSSCPALDFRTISRNPLSCDLSPRRVGRRPCG